MGYIKESLRSKQKYWCECCNVYAVKVRYKKDSNLGCRFKEGRKP